MFADMIVIVEGIVTVVEQRYDLYSWYMLLVVGGSRICNQIYMIPRAATWTLLLWCTEYTLNKTVMLNLTAIQQMATLLQPFTMTGTYGRIREVCRSYQTASRNCCAIVSENVVSSCSYRLKALSLTSSCLNSAQRTQTKYYRELSVASATVPLNGQATPVRAVMVDRHRPVKIQDSRFKICIHSNHLPWYIEDHKISINS